MKSKGCLTVIIGWVVSTLFLAILFSVMNKTGESMGSIMFAAVFIGLCMAFVIFASQMAVMTGRARRADAKAGITRYEVTHDGGLQAPANTRAYVVLSPETMTINCCGNEFVLATAKLRNVDFQTDVKYKQHVENTYGRNRLVVDREGNLENRWGAIPRVRTRCLRVGYMTITYESSSGRYISFRLSDVYANQYVCMKLASKLRSYTNPKVKKVQL